NYILGQISSLYTVLFDILSGSKGIAQFTYQVWLHCQVSQSSSWEISLAQTLWQTYRLVFGAYILRKIKHASSHTAGRLNTDNLLHHSGLTVVSASARDKESSGNGSLSAFVKIYPDVLYTGSSTVHCNDSMCFSFCYSIKICRFDDLCDPPDGTIVVVNSYLLFYRILIASDIVVVKIQFIIGQ